jgi:hypothetical protein
MVAVAWIIQGTVSIAEDSTLNEFSLRLFQYKPTLEQEVLIRNRRELQDSSFSAIFGAVI